MRRSARIINFIVHVRCEVLEGSIAAGPNDRQLSDPRLTVGDLQLARTPFSGRLLARRAQSVITEQSGGYRLTVMGGQMRLSCV